MVELNLVSDLNIQDPPQGPSSLLSSLLLCLTQHFSPTKLDCVHNPDISCHLYILEDGDLKGSEPLCY